MTIWVIVIGFIYAVLMAILASRAYSNGFRDGYSWSRWEAEKIAGFFPIHPQIWKARGRPIWTVPADNSHTLN